MYHGMTEADSETIAAEAPARIAASFTESGFIETFDRRYPALILETLLCDRTTGRNIIWANNEYEALGDGYMGDDEITVEKITGTNFRCYQATHCQRTGKAVPAHQDPCRGVHAVVDV